MKKLLLSFIALIILVPSIMHAVAAMPQSGVWFTPADAKAGTDIVLNTLVYNDTKEQATIVVTFKEGTTIIGTADALNVPADTAKTATFTWTMPAVKTVVTASVTSATNKSKKQIPSLVGDLGTVTIGGAADIALPKMTNVRGFFAGIVNYLEEFRVKELAYFTKLKTKSQEVLGTTTIKDIQDILQPEVPGVPGEPATVEPETPKKDNTMAYLTLVYATVGKAFFARKALFFVSVALLALFVIRFIFRRFF